MEPLGLRRLLLVLAGWLALAGGLRAAEAVAPGEWGIYALRWNWVRVGTTELRLEAGGEDEWIATLDARANAFLRQFYDFHTTIESRFPAGVPFSRHYERHENPAGIRHRTLFAWEPGEVRYQRNEDLRPPLALKGPVQDPLSIVYAFREGRVPRTPGTHFLPVTDGKAMVEVRLEVGQPRPVRTPAGKFQAFPVTADFGAVRAIFARPEGALITLWLTDDRYLFPVRLESEATIGQFNAVLEDYFLPGAGPDGQSLPARLSPL